MNRPPDNRTPFEMPELEVRRDQPSPHLAAALAVSVGACVVVWAYLFVSGVL